MKSFALGLFTLVAVLLFTFTLVFVWTGSAGIRYQRVAMTGDRSTAEVMNEFSEARRAEAVEVTYDPGMDLGPGDAAMRGQDSAEGGGANTVVWINIPGFRGDYIDSAPAPFLGEMVKDGSSTTRMRPNFPPLTFPGHVTMATGTTPSVHGIPSDIFRAGSEIVTRPTDPSLLQAEPIWQTATRQGLVTLVHDWPLSQNQTGPDAAAYFLTDFDPDLTDQQRLDRLWDAWSKHEGEKKLRLLMTRLEDVLRAGLVNGPRSDGTYEAVKKTDEVLKGFFERVKAAWPNLREKPSDNLVFLVTTDHGIVALDKNVNLPHLLGDVLMKNLDIAAHDAIAHLYFKDLPESVAEANLLKETIDSELKKKIYFRTYQPEDLPSEWNYTSADGRIGDRVLVLKAGFAFTDFKAEEPVFDPSEGPGYYGGYGYPVIDSIRMSGQVLFWGYPEQVGSGDLGEIDLTGFHATVCRWLKIERSEKAQDNALPAR